VFNYQWCTVQTWRLCSDIKESIKYRIFVVYVIFQDRVYLTGVFYSSESRKLMTKAATGTEKVKMPVFNSSGLTAQLVFRVFMGCNARRDFFLFTRINWPDTRRLFPRWLAAWLLICRLVCTCVWENCRLDARCWIDAYQKYRQLALSDGDRFVCIGREEQKCHRCCSKFCFERRFSSFCSLLPS